MDEVKTAINEVKKMIDINMFGTRNYNKFDLFDGYHRVYFQTNENIEGYLSLEDLSHKEKALCVAGSGDQAFSLISKGINNIQLFDINKLTEYMIMGLKKTMILKYNYSKYFDMIIKLIDSKTSYNFIYNTISELIPYMEEKYQYFWLEVINYYKELQLQEKTDYNLIHMLSLINVEQIVKNNSTYLNSKEDYNSLKTNLKETQINFKYINALNLKSELKNNKYDLILLSNILDYFHLYWHSNWPISYLECYVDGLTNLMNNNSILFLHYAFTPYIWPKIFSGTNIKLKNLPASYEVRELDNLNNLKQKDTIILKRMR